MSAVGVIGGGLGRFRAGAVIAAVDGDSDEAGGGELPEQRDLTFFVAAGAVQGDDDGAAGP